MSVNVNEIIERARDVMNVGLVFGEPIHQNGVTVVPVAAVRGGGGGGGGPDPRSGRRAGAAASASSPDRSARS